ncbi:hypothetical protein [Qipengyuania nanhaisediminis]|uniref:hypothetical protein n=1 Tax=Qipengyuania nanhaisediminis TaxID=604088 RepID=UPI0038B31D65
MSRIWGGFVVSALCLALAACGGEETGEFVTEDGDEGQYEVDPVSGETSMTVDTADGAVSLRSGANVPLDLPAGFTLITGAQVLTNTVVDQAQGKGTLVSFRTEKSPDDIAAFYRQQAEAAGIAIQISTEMNGGRMLGGENEASGMTFTVTAYPAEDGTTTGQLVIGEGG